MYTGDCQQIVHTAISFLCVQQVSNYVNKVSKINETHVDGSEYMKTH